MHITQDYNFIVYKEAYYLLQITLGREKQVE